MPTYQELVAQASQQGIPYYDLQNLGSGQAFQDALAQRISGQGDPNQSTGGTWGGSTGYAPTLSTTQPGVIDNDYGYFDQGNIQAMNDANNRLQEAFQRGDTAAFQQALDQYRQVTGGLTPVSMQGITPEMVAQNSRNPGGPNAGYQYPQNTPSTPSPNGAPTGFSYGGATPLATPPAQGAQTPITPPAGPPRGGMPSGADDYGAPAATPLAGRVNSTPLGTDPAAGPRGTPRGGIGAAAIGDPGNAIDDRSRVIPTGPTPPNRPNPPVATPPGPVRTTPSPPTTPTNPDAPRVPPGRTPGSPITPPISPYTPAGPGSPPTPNSPYTAAAFPSWSTWNNGQPYQEGDPGMMATSEQNRATDYGNLFQNEFGSAYGDAQRQAGAYGQAADSAYSDLYQNPGFNAGEADMIQNGGIEGGLNSLRANQGELNQNYLTPEEQASIQGNPNAAYDAFDPNTLNDLAQTGTNATQSFFGKNYQSAQDALTAGSDRSAAMLGQYGTNARGDLSTMKSDLYGAIDPTKLGISDSEVERLKEQAGRQVGFQYGAAIDDLQRKAEAAGNVSPLALSAARDRLLRSQAVDSANAVNNADLAARAQQRTAEQDISNRRIGVGTTVGNAGIGLEGDIASTGLNASQNQAALGAGTEATYGTLGTNLGLNTTKQLTDTANTAGQTRIQQAEYGDTNAANRAATVATNRQNVNTNNLNTRFGQGTTTAAANSANAATVGNARIAGQQAARNYWQGQNQFQGGQANAAAGQQVSGAQTSLSGQGQAGSTAVGNLNARRNPIQIGGIGFTL